MRSGNYSLCDAEGTRGVVLIVLYRFNCLLISVAADVSIVVVAAVCLGDAAIVNFAFAILIVFVLWVAPHFCCATSHRIFLSACFARGLTSAAESGEVE